MKIQFERVVKELLFEFTRSSGPGGQHVNRTDSAVIARWNLFTSQSLDEEARELLSIKLSNRLTSEGELLIRCSSQRSQRSNKIACSSRFIEILKSAVHVPKARRKTRPTKASQEKRRQKKKMRSDTKKLRTKPQDW